MIDVGKLPNKELKKLLKCIRKNPKVIILPAPGLDSGVHSINEDEYLVVSTDPCIDVPEEWFGWLLVHYAASDVALFGAKPEFCTINLLGPPKTKANVFIEIMEQVCTAADGLNMTIITGHTGTYDGLATIVGACTAYGFVSKDRLITPGGAQCGDYIVCTKQIGLETVVNFTLTHKALAESLFNVNRTRELQSLMSRQSCVAEASRLSEIEGVHAMHDITEGGLVMCLNEMADSSNLGFTIYREKLPILEEVRAVRRQFNLSRTEILSISSTGSLVASIDSQKTEDALRELAKNEIEATLIGAFTEDKKRILRRGKHTSVFPKVAKDPYSKIMRRQRH
jgi:hydrogenase maturation factor